MNDLISRQMAIDAAMQDVSDKRSHDFNAGATRAANRIKLLPSIEKEEIIRCKDCKHRFGGKELHNCCEILMEMSQWLVEIPVKDEWHCGSGERKEKCDM